MSVSVSWDASEVGDLANDLARVPVQVAKRLFGTGDDAADRVQRGWAEHAVGTARAHGKHYPKSIQAEKIGDLEWKIEPDAGMPQGGMSFEYGSRNQPPHLDMNITMDREGPRFVHEVAEDVLPWW